jgi:hypothetical protein
MISGTTDYARIDGKDVVFVNDDSGHLYKYTVADVNDASTDTWALVGTTSHPYSGTGAGAYDPDLNIYLRTSATSFSYWDLSNPAGNVLFSPEDRTGLFNGTGGGVGMEYDPVRHQFAIWQGDGTIWYLKPPDVLSSSGWTLEKAPDPTLPAPTIPDPFTGVLGKWDYIDKYDVFIGVDNQFSGDVWVYKPPGWTGASEINSSGNTFTGGPGPDGGHRQRHLCLQSTN